MEREAVALELGDLRLGARPDMGDEALARSDGQRLALLPAAGSVFRLRRIAFEPRGVGGPVVSFLDLYSPALITGDEKALLHTHLKVNRDVLIWKLEGLKEEDRRRPLTGTGTNLIGIVKHLTGIEGAYFCDAFGRDRPPLSWEADPDAAVGEFSDMYATPEETTEELVAAYRAATAAADRSIEELDLDDTGTHHLGLTVSLRWMLLIVLLDTARHAGHSDIVRELIDGAVGGNREWPGVDTSDTEHQAVYLARVRGEIDTPAWHDYITQRHATRSWAPRGAACSPRLSERT